MAIFYRAWGQTITTEGLTTRSEARFSLRLWATHHDEGLILWQPGHSLGFQIMGRMRQFSLWIGYQQRHYLWRTRHFHGAMDDLQRGPAVTLLGLNLGPFYATLFLPF